jgi:hypothetical protein
MTTREVAIAGIVLVVLLIVLGAVNFYVVKPALTPEIPDKPQLSSTAGGGSAVDRSVVAATLERIKAAPGGGEISPFDPREVERNPFFWPGELAAKQRAAMDEGREQVDSEPGEEAPVVDEWLQTAVVSMILVSDKGSMAVLNEEFVRKGSVVDDHKVVGIEKNAVMVQGPTGVERLEIGEMDYGKVGPAPEGAPQQQAQAPMDEEFQGAIDAGTAGMPAPPTAAQQEAVERLMERLAPLMGGQ